MMSDPWVRKRSTSWAGEDCAEDTRRRAGGRQPFGGDCERLPSTFGCVLVGCDERKTETTECICDANSLGHLEY